MINYIFIYYIISTIIFTGIISDRTNRGKWTWLDIIIIISLGWCLTPVAISYVIGRYIGYLISKY